MAPWASCAAGKAKQKQIPNMFTCVKAGVPGGQYGYATSTINDSHAVKPPQTKCHLQRDEATR